MTAPRRTLLLILDGAGWRTDTHGNAVTPETLPRLFAAIERGGVAVLEASGEAVGLEAGQVGNSEAGHMTIGAGRVVPSLARRMLEAHRSGALAADPAWQRIARHGCVHLVGLVSDAGVHGLTRTLWHAAAAAAANGVGEIVVHPVLDGVDSLAGSAPALLAELERELAGIPGVKFGVIQGRKAFCDRSGNLEVSRPCLEALTGKTTLPVFEHGALERHLEAAGEKDFPAHLWRGGRALRPGEPVVHTSHRADRARPIAGLLAASQPLFAMVELGKGIEVQHVFFPTQVLDRGLPFEFKRAGLTSTRIAEKCKFPHVTFFLNGFDAGTEGRGICLDSIPEAEIPAKPEMSAEAITAEVERALADPAQRVVIANLANLDQVGHLGNLALARRAATTVDACYARLAEAARRHGWTLFVTSDHGNADTLIGADGGAYGSHSESPVPFVIVPAPGLEARWERRAGSLANVAATVLDSLALPVPAWMEPPLARFS